MFFFALFSDSLLFFNTIVTKNISNLFLFVYLSVLWPLLLLLLKKALWLGNIPSVAVGFGWGRMVTEWRNKRIDLSLSLTVFLLSKSKFTKVVFRFSFAKTTKPKLAALILLLYLSFLDNCFTIVNCFDYFIAILNFHVFLEHFPEKIILHLADYTFLLDYF